VIRELKQSLHFFSLSHAILLFLSRTLQRLPVTVVELILISRAGKIEIFNR